MEESDSHAVQKFRLGKDCAHGVDNNIQKILICIKDQEQSLEILNLDILT